MERPQQKFGQREGKTLFRERNITRGGGPGAQTNLSEENGELPLAPKRKDMLKKEGANEKYEQSE